MKVNGLPWWLSGKESACNAGDLGSIPGSGRSPREGTGYPLQYSCLENSWTEEPGGLQSMGQQRVGHDWVTNYLKVNMATHRLLAVDTDRPICNICRVWSKYKMYVYIPYTYQVKLTNCYIKSVLSIHSWYINLPIDLEVQVWVKSWIPQSWMLECVCMMLSPPLSLNP